MIYSKKEWDKHIGEEVVITQKPTSWDSSIAPLEPLDLNFPWKGVVINTNKKNGGGAVNINGYGFDIDKTDVEFKPTNYEIY